MKRCVSVVMFWHLSPRRDPFTCCITFISDQRNRLILENPTYPVLSKLHTVLVVSAIRCIQLA